MPDSSKSDFALVARPALAGKATIRRNGLMLEALPEGHVIHVLGKSDGADLAPILSAAFAGSQTAVRTSGPGQWFLVGDRALTCPDYQAIIALLPNAAAGIDQSHGRVRMRVSGPMAERVLAKGTAVDLAPESFPVGRATTTLFGHISAHLTRTGADAFELMVLRGFAESLRDELDTMSAEFA